MSYTSKVNLAQQHGGHLEWISNAINLSHKYCPVYCSGWGFPGSSVVKNPHAKAGDAEDPSSIPELRRYPGGGNGNLLQYSCLENSMDRGTWQLQSIQSVYGVTKSWKHLSMHTNMDINT